MKLYGRPATKELKKTHLSGWIGGVEMGSWVASTCEKVAASRLGRMRWWLADQDIPRLCADKLEEQLGSETDCKTQDSSVGK